MVVLLSLLAVVSVGAIAGSLALVGRDGYRRVPERTYVRIY